MLKIFRYVSEDLFFQLSKLCLKILNWAMLAVEAGLRKI